ncbi:MAG: isocitrate lyase/phosphoenolpyruvate mutase family protein [Candidatus Helarchaeota archaeon]|nr:isocitrate lyase/phosphoenolpyruvate mutase family protein [Candidatus Helarchaeota archaeon]
MKEFKTLNDILEEKELIMVPGALDALTAKLVEEQGFDAVHMTGFGTSVSNFGLPDRGLITLTEMVQTASRMVDAITIPLIADAETGFGNPLNVVRTVKQFEKAGVAGLHIEDQVWPKRCGHMAGKSVIEVDEMVGKIRAAVDTRKNPNFVIIARTDALATHGFDHAIERCKIYAEAGADMLFIDGVKRMGHLKKIPKLLKDKPNIVNMGPLTPNLSADELKKLGYSIAAYPGICLVAKILACREDLKRLKETGRQRDFIEIVQAFPNFNEFLGDTRYSELERKYAVKKE